MPCQTTMDLNKSTGKDITKYLSGTTQFEWTLTVIQGIREEIKKKIPRVKMKMRIQFTRTYGA